jgi:hypothetical protein
MTHPHTAGRAESPAIRLGRPEVLLGRKLREARQLQRKGMTMFEIAEILDVRRLSVVKALYDDVVAK